MVHSPGLTADQLDRPTAPSNVRVALSKVPEVTAYFWIIKVLTTGMGEAFSDFLATTFDPFLAVGAAGLALLVALVVQFRVKRYIPWVYWTAVVMVSVFGTMAADVLHVVLGVPYSMSTAGFLVVLGVIFMVWYSTEKTLSIHSIRTPRRELFYWLTVMTTFALGTAAGDLSASLGLGYFTSGLIFAVAIAIPALAHLVLRLNAIVAFWIAYILTRPLGASFADWMGAPKEHHGLGLGWGPVTLAWTVLILVFVGYLALTGKDTDRSA